MKRKPLIARTYRISEKDDKLIKKNAKKFGGESAYLRALIRTDEAFKKIEKRDIVFEMRYNREK